MQFLSLFLSSLIELSQESQFSLPQSVFSEGLLLCKRSSILSPARSITFIFMFVQGLNSCIIFLIALANILSSVCWTKSIDFGGSSLPPKSLVSFFSFRIFSNSPFSPFFSISFSWFSSFLFLRNQLYFSTNFLSTLALRLSLPLSSPQL